MPNYNKCFIYKICCKDANITDCYIGSTTNIIRRRTEHKSSCTCISNRAYNQFVYTFVRANGGWDNFDLIAIEEFSCETKMQQTKKERDWIEQIKPTLNKCVPSNYQTGEVYDQKEYHKEYYENNKEAIKEYQKENKETIKVKKAEYYENNKEAFKEYQKEYNEANKVQRAEYRQKEIHCPCCNHMIRINDRSKHYKTNKHITNSSSSSNTPESSD